MPLVPDSLKKPLADAGAKVRAQSGGMSQKLRQLDPKRAKSSATSGVSGAKEVLQLAIAYIKQETVEPVKGIGRFLAFGIAGGIFMGVGLLLGLLALLRAVQTESGAHLTGSLTWVPYLVTALGCVVVLAMIWFAFSRSGPNPKDRR